MGSPNGHMNMCPAAMKYQRVHHSVLTIGGGGFGDGLLTIFFSIHGFQSVRDFYFS